MRATIARHFNLPENYRNTLYAGGCFQKLTSDLQHACLNRGFLALAGDTGAGKTTLLNYAINSLQQRAVTVRVRCLDKENLRINAIVNAMIFDLSNEGPRHDFEARSRQLQRIVGTAAVNAGHRVVVIIENAHRLHGNTLLSLKELRELDFAGASPLFGIVLVGQTPLLLKIARLREIALRTDNIELSESSGWMGFDERRRFLKHVFAGALDDDIRTQVALARKAPAEMIRLVEEKVEAAYYAGKSVLDVTDFDLPIAQMKDALGITLRELEVETGHSKSAIQRAINGSTGGTFTQNVRTAVMDAIKRAARRDSTNQPNQQRKIA